MRLATAVSACLILFSLHARGAQAADYEITADSAQGEVSWAPPSGVPISVEGARHGTAAIVGASVTYSPTPGGDFWTVGSERLLVRVAHETTSGSVYALKILAGSPGFGPPTTHFEAGETLPPIEGLDTQVFLRPAGALLGDVGAHIVLDGSGDPAFVQYRLDGFLDTGPSGDPNGDPNSTPAGCADLRMAIDSGTRALLTECQGESDTVNCGALSLLKALTADGVELFRIEVGLTATSTQFRALAFEPGGSRRATPWVTTSALPHEVRLDWWTEGSGGARLRIDGRVRGELRGLNMADLSVADLRIGAPDSAPGSSHNLAVDAITVRSGDAAREVSPGTADAFESDLSSWNAMSEAAGFLRVSAAAALGGDSGLEIDFDEHSGGWGAWILDTVPDSSASMGLRFRIDAADLEIPQNQTLVLALGQTSNGETVASRFMIRLWQSPSGQTRIRASARDDSDTRHVLPYVSLGGPGVNHHQVELEWRAAREPGSEDGWLRFWLDGALIGELTELDNDELFVNSLRFGAMFVASGTRGELRLDEFESWH
ncbi:MAG: hypothetical protein AAF725_04665 [Acidobacteriota bacterium]